MNKSICVLICSAVCLLPAAAQAPGPDPVVRELARIRASLDRLAELLEEARAGQQADLLLRRIDRKERRLIPLESRLRSVRQQRENVEEEQMQVAAYREQFEEEMRAARDRGENPEQGSRLVTEQIETQEEALEKRMERLDLLIRQLEDQIAEHLEEIEILEAALEEMLARWPGSD